MDWIARIAIIIVQTLFFGGGLAFVVVGMLSSNGPCGMDPGGPPFPVHPSVPIICFVIGFLIACAFAFAFFPLS